MSSHSLCEKCLLQTGKYLSKWMKFPKMQNNPPALFKYLSHGEGRGGEGTACSNTITSQLWLTLNLGHPTITPHHPRRGDTDWHPQVGGERGGIPEEQVQGVLPRSHHWIRVLQTPASCWPRHCHHCPPLSTLRQSGLEMEMHPAESWLEIGDWSVERSNNMARMWWIKLMQTSAIKIKRWKLVVWPIGLIIFLLYLVSHWFILSLTAPSRGDGPPSLLPFPPTGGCGHVARRENILVNLGKLGSLKW